MILGCAALLLAAIVDDGAGAGADAAPPATDAADADAPLPAALPPLDDALLGGDGDDAGGVPVDVFGDARVRALFSDEANAAAPLGGFGLTGWLGAHAQLSDLTLTIAVGDGGWWLIPTTTSAASGTPASTSTARLDLVARPFVTQVMELHVAVPLLPLGVPGRLQVGRMRLDVADGRFVGREDFDARGRTVDGAVVDAAFAYALARGGVVALDSGVVDEDGTATGGALAFVDVDVDVEGAVDALAGGAVSDVDVDVYALAHHQRTTLRPTLGARAHAALFGLVVRAGVDGQLALDETAGLTTTGGGLHGELGVRTALPWPRHTPQPFVGASVEATGDVLAPAPTLHGTLGGLDLATFGNTRVLGAEAGVVDVDSGFAAQLTWRNVAALGPVVDRAGVLLGDTGLLFSAVDVGVVVPVADSGVDLRVDFAFAAKDKEPLQRFLIGLAGRFPRDVDAHDDDGGPR